MHYSDFRDYPEMVTFIDSIVEVVRMQRRRFRQVLESTMFRSIARPRSLLLRADRGQHSPSKAYRGEASQ
jgi:hypothetical protein